MIPRSDERYLSLSSSPTQRFIGKQQATLLIKLNPRHHREVILVKRQCIFVGGQFLLSMRNQMLVILLRIEPQLAIASDHDEERLAISL